MPRVLEFLDPERGLQDVLLISGDTSPLVTPERMNEMHRLELLAQPPIEVEGLGTIARRLETLPHRHRRPGRLPRLASQNNPEGVMKRDNTLRHLFGSYLFGTR